MWKFYCFPGRIITELAYLFPGRGELWATARRRESGFAAFLFATPFWLVVGFFGLGVVGSVIGHFMGRKNDDAPQSLSTTVSPATSETVDSVQGDRGAAAQSAVDQPAPSSPTQLGDRDAASTNVETPPAPLSSVESDTKSDTGAETRGDATASVLADPSSDPKIDKAMHEALSTGQPVRWHVTKLHGYATVSTPDVNNCRMVQVSIDDTGQESNAVKLCP